MNSSSSFINEDESVILNGNGIEFRFGELREVAEAFGLGELIEFPDYERYGNSNYLFRLKTEKGNFMLRTSAKEKTPDRERRLSFEHAVTRHLSEKGFPYEIPIFAKLKDGGEILRKGERVYDVYRRVEGVNMKKTGFEVIPAVALMHKILESFPNHSRPTESQETYDPGRWFLNKLEAMRKGLEEPRSETEAQLVDNLPMIFQAYGELVRYAKPMPSDVIAHRDIHSGNLVYSDGNFKGLIDFGNSNWGTKGMDLRGYTYGSEEKLFGAIDKYREFNFLSESEARNVLPNAIWDALNSINWVYNNRERNPLKMDEIIEGRLTRLEGTFVNWQKLREKVA